MTLRRIACIDLAELPLQILVRAHADWRFEPVAVVAEERPDAPLLLINRAARELRLCTGMRFGAAKSLVPTLRAGAVPTLLVEETVAQLVHDLQTFSPHVERDPVSAGVFYIDPSGLSHLYGGELNWARSVQRYLLGRGFYASIVVAFGRSLTYALTRIGRGPKLVETIEETLQRAHEVPLDRLAIAPKVRDALERVGLTTLGDLVNLPVDALRTRFGREAAAWCQVARGEEILPLVAEAHVEALRSEVEIDPPDSDVARLCFALKRGLDSLLEDVRQRGQSVRAVWLRFHFERPTTGACAQRLEPSSPTRDGHLLLELLRLRLTAMSLPDQVERVVLEAETVDLAPGQLSMFMPRRDAAAGARAIARLKASYGDDVVATLSLEEAHLPEAKFRFTEIGQLSPPGPEVLDRERTEAPLVRRVFSRPVPLEAALVAQAGEVFLSCSEGSLPLSGPYRVSGGWWVKQVERDYYYAHTSQGGSWWVFYDRPRTAWFLHGFID